VEDTWIDIHFVRRRLSHVQQLQLVSRAYASSRITASHCISWPKHYGPSVYTIPSRCLHGAALEIPQMAVAVAFCKPKPCGPGLTSCHKFAIVSCNSIFQGSNNGKALLLQARQLLV
jgi:hypothetical protein